MSNDPLSHPIHKHLGNQFSWVLDRCRELAQTWMMHSTREKARPEVLYALEIEMSLDGDVMDEYRSEVEYILDAELDKVELERARVMLGDIARFITLLDPSYHLESNWGQSIYRNLEQLHINVVGEESEKTVNADTTGTTTPLLDSTE